MNTVRIANAGTRHAVPVFSGELFAWTPTSGVTEASTLGFEVGLWPNVVGVVSHRTGAEKRFVFSHLANRGTVAIYHESLKRELVLEVLNT